MNGKYQNNLDYNILFFKQMTSKCNKLAYCKLISFIFEMFVTKRQNDNENQ